MFASRIEDDLATSICEFHLWSVDPHLSNLLNNFNALPVFQTIESRDDAEKLVRRYREIPRVIEQHIENLRIGREHGYVANAEAVRLMIEAIRRDRTEPGSPLLTPADAERPGWAPGARNSFGAELREVVETAIEPAFEAYARFLREEILPHARGPANEGIAGIPNGEACYAARVRAMTTLPNATADSLHTEGLNEISWINAQMTVIGEAELGEAESAPLMWRLRMDRNLQFQNGDEIVAASKAALAKATAAVPDSFGTLPKTQCEVVPVPAYRAASTPAGYYTLTGPHDARIGRLARIPIW